MTNNEIRIRECETIEELNACARLQKEVFALPDLEVSPRRHLIVTKSAGGFTLGAFAENTLVGFVLSVPGFRGAERFFYSHMTAVSARFQNLHVGTRLKWAQRARALREDVKFIKWTFQPTQARNAFFNLERLGAIIKTYAPNFYGTDYSTVHNEIGQIGLDSDRLFCEWHLESEKAKKLEKGEKFEEFGEVVQTIEIPNDWNCLVKANPEEAVAEQTRVKEEFQNAFAQNLICKGFERNEKNPKYLLYKN
ncbi:MAG TPA: GNAT family N-acetyltransferase [Pyrinomonadaceae bacterium]|nr:GNAT family N-acetyltransferase [Pyrinomonadaceae bacterium]